jgi:hypothetical protein
MTAVVLTELFKLRTTRAPWAVVTGVAAVAATILALNGALLGKPGQPAIDPAVLGQLARAPGMLVAAAALLLGLLLSTSEFRHGTILTTRLAVPRARRSVLAKAVAAAVAAAVLAVAVDLGMLGGTAAILAGHQVPVEPLRHGIPAAVASTLLVAALFGVAGVGIGELLRNPALAIGVGFGWAFVVEGVLPVVLRSPGLSTWLPMGSARAALSLGWPRDSALLTPWTGISMVAAYAVALLLAGLGRSTRTDP